MNLRYVEVIHALMSAPSMTKAAENLNISQPAVSIMLKRAEAQLGCKLFERIAGRLHPTAEALILKEELDDIFARIETFKRLAQDLSDGRRGSLTVAASPSLASGYLPSVIMQFQKDGGDASIDIQSVPSVRVVDMVSRREADLGFSYHTPPDLGTSVELIGTASIACIVPISNPLSKKPAITPADLADAQIISYAGRAPFGRLVKAAFDEASVPLQVAIEVHNSAEATFLVMAGGGIALIDPILAEPYSLPSVAVIPFQPEVSLPLQLVFAKGRPQSRVTIRFSQQLRNHAKFRRRSPATGPAEPLDSQTCGGQLQEDPA